MLILQLIENWQVAACVYWVDLILIIGYPHKHVPEPYFSSVLLEMGMFSEIQFLKKVTNLHHPILKGGILNAHFTCEKFQPHPCWVALKRQKVSTYHNFPNNKV